MSGCNGYLGFFRWRPIMGVMAAGVLACSLTMQGASADTNKSATGGFSPFVYKGYPVPVESIPMAAPVQAHSPELFIFEGEATRPFITVPSDEGNDGIAAALTQNPITGCELDIECDDCNPCTADTCDLGVGCVHTPLEDCDACDDGIFCNGQEVCDSGVCVAATAVKRFLCNGGPFDGRSCPKGDGDCDFCTDGDRAGEKCCPGIQGSGVGGDCVGGVCQGGSRDQQACCPNGTCDTTPVCKLQFFNPDPCRLQPNQVCDDEEVTASGTLGACVAACFDNTDCDDGLACNGVETCVKGGTPGEGGKCIGGSAPGQSCTVDGDCPDGGQCGGVCRFGAALCTGLVGTSDAAGYVTTCEEGAPPTCGRGRCCQENGKEFDCSRDTRENCLNAGGIWLGVGDLPETDQDDGGDPPNSPTCRRVAGSNYPAAVQGDDFGCPKYSAGLAQGNVVGILGDVAVAQCHDYWEIGDDYQLENCNPGLCQDGVTACNDDKDCIDALAGAPCKGGPQNYEIHAVRWLGGNIAGVGSRMRVSFYTANGDFIEDVITDPAAPGIARRTIVFGEHPVVPCKGFFTIKPAVDFSPDNQLEWAVTDDGETRSGSLKVSCTPGDGNVGCSDEFIYGRPHPEPPVADNTDKVGDLVAIASGRLALEIVGEKAPAPVGACCSPETGVCELETPWDCRAAGSTFQGLGTQCNVCSNSPFTGCSVDANCFECTGGDRAGQFCCPGGGTCDNGQVPPTCVGGDRSGLECCPSGSCDKASGNECLPVPPACTISACCDKATGDCTEVTGGGFCSGDGTTACLNDLQCQPTPGGTCEPDCPVGSNSAGFGSRCINPATNSDNNCCRQPNDLAGDTCDVADTPVVNIPVPTFGNPPVTVTFTSNNKSATFGDFVGDGSGTCELGIFDPAGGTRDRGWWHAFSINDCADVRIDMCCTGDVISDKPHRPQWAFLTTDCNPCTGLVGNAVVGPGSFPSVPIGTKTDPNDRGGPFCPGADDLWQTFSLDAGTYYHPIYSAPGGHFGDYQLHVTVGACRVAACCLPDGSCAELTQSDCDDQGGFWKAFPNIPIEDADTTECKDPGGNQACELGSCCLGPGQCRDWSNPNCDPTNPDDPDCCQPDGSNCMDEALCDTLTNGVFVGGSRCDYPTNPCPACQIQGSANCHLVQQSGLVSFMSDWAVKPGGVKHADDFVPTTTQINQICTWGTYQDPKNSVDNNGCLGEVEDDFVVRIYEDNAGLPGKLLFQRDNADDGTGIGGLPPCQLAGGCPGPVTAAFSDTPFTSPANGPDLPVRVYTLTFPTINLPAANVTYWLEIANNTHTPTGAPQPISNTCYWWQISGWPSGDPAGETGVFEGANLWCAVSGSNVGPNPDTTGGGDPIAGARYNRLSGRWADLSWCIGNNGNPVNVTEPTTPVGACCDCAGSCTNGVTAGDCADRTRGQGKRFSLLEYGLCQDNATLCTQDEDCPLVVRPCQLGKATATCGGHTCEFPTGDNCGSAVALGSTAAGLDCSQPQPQPGACIEATDGHFEFDSACATTDGANPAPGSNWLGHDTWVCYETTCTGELVISMCASSMFYGGQDSYMQIFHDGTDPTGDVPCPTGSDFDLMIADGDESCNGNFGGAGHFEGRIVVPGEKYLVRMGGWGGSLATTDAGHMALDIACLARACLPALKPEKATLIASGTPQPDAYSTNRYLPVRLLDIDRPSRIRVDAVNLPPPHAGSACDGQTWWAGTPYPVCEKANQGAKPGTSCQAVPGEPKGRNHNWYADLVCDQGLAGDILPGTCQGGVCNGGFAAGDPCSDDSHCSTLYLKHECIVPSARNDNAVYEVRALAEGCLKDSLDNFSEALVITQNKLGNFVGVGVACENPAPDAAVGLPDVNALLAKFANASCQIKKARGDIRGPIGGAVDNVVSLPDINAVLFGFTNPTSLNWSPPANACGLGATSTQETAAGDLTPQEAAVASTPVQRTTGGQ